VRPHCDPLPRGRAAPDAGDARCVAVQAGVRAIADTFRKALCRNGVLREHYSSAPHPLFFKAIQI
jgi:hypothetical protein